MEKMYYSIAEVCNLLDIKHYNIRYWEKEFPQLKSKTKKGYSRRYTKKDIEFLKIIRELIYDKKFTLEGAMAEAKRISRKTTESYINEECEMRNAELPPPPVLTQSFGREVIENTENLTFIKSELLEIKKLLLRRGA